ncbi:hypothetical protein WDW89_10480 [Deltaproteobacteria bacterium TL4]
MKIFRLIFISFFWLLPLSFAHAGEFRRIGQGIRNLGMGNTGVALSYDEGALYYNPAGLASVDALWIKIPIQLEASDEIYQFYQEQQNLSGSSSVGDLAAIGLNKKIHLKYANSLLSAVIPFEGFGFGFNYNVIDFRFDMIIKNPIFAELSMGFRLDIFNSVGLGIELGDGHWLVGVSAHTIKRCEFNTTVSLGNLFSLLSLSSGDTSDQAAVIEALNESGVAETSPCLTNGLSLNPENYQLEGASEAQTYDIGIQRRMESADALRITWGLVINKVTGMSFERSGGHSLPKDEEPEVSIGISFQPQVSWFRTLWELDIRDITQSHVDDDPKCNCFEKRIHSGLEIGILPIDSGASFLSLRTGSNQGYLTYGVELNFFVFWRIMTLQYANYIIETGTNAGDRPEKRHLVELSFGI